MLMSKEERTSGMCKGAPEAPSRRKYCPHVPCINSVSLLLSTGASIPRTQTVCHSVS